MAPRRILPTPATAGKTVEMRAVPKTRVMLETPCESPVCPQVTARNGCASISTVGNSVQCGATGSEAPQFPMAIPIKLWRNPNLQPVSMSPLIRVAPPCESSPGSNVQVQGAAVKVRGEVPKDATPQKGTVFVVKKMDGRTVITAQEVTGKAAVKKIAREVRAASNGQVRTFSPAFAKPSSLPLKADPPRQVITVADDGASVAPVYHLKTGVNETRVVFPRQKNAADTEGRREISVGTQTGSSSKSVPKSKNPPAVVHVVPVPEPARTTSRPPKRLECIKVSDSLVCLKPSVPQEKLQEQVRKPRGDDHGKTQGVICIKQDPPETVEDACSQQEDADSGGWDIKISNVVSLAGREEDMSDTDLGSLCADKSEGGKIREVAQSAVPGSVHIDKKSPEKVSEVKETLFSMCKLREVEGGSENEPIELCSFQTTKGNAVMGSQIVFKPTPSSSSGSKDSAPVSKVAKLKQAIELFEESTLQDNSLFSEKEKAMLTSLFRRFKDDALAARSEPGPSNPKLAPAAKSPLKSDPEVRVKSKSPADEKPNAEGGDVRVEPEGQPATQPANNGDLPVTPHKPLRRIVITSDHVPTMNSEHIKAGIEAFLVTNNISNNFNADEVVKLHWDGHDVSTFHFRETDSPPVKVPPKVVRPTILRTKKTSPSDSPTKDSAGAGSAAVEPLGTVAASTESKPESVDTSVQQSKTDLNEVKVPPSNFKPVRLKYVTDTGQVVEQVVIKAVKAMPTLRGGGIQSDKQLAFMPRAIRYVKKTGEIIEQPVNPEQQVVPVYSSGQPSSGNPAGNTQVRSLLPNSKSIIRVQPVLPTAESLKRLLDAARSAVPSPTSRKAEPTYGASSTGNCLNGSVPFVPPHTVATKTEARGHESGSSSSRNGVMSAQQAYEAVLLASRMPPSSSESDGGTNLFEPEVLLEESNGVIEVKPLGGKGQLENDTSSDETTTSSDDDYIPPFKKLAPSPKRPPAPKKQTTAVQKTSVQKKAAQKKSVRGLSKSKRKRSRKRNAAALTQSAAPPPAAARSKRVVDVAMLSSNCIDRPCVVDMHRLNDRFCTKGFVDLSAVEQDDLFVLADSPEVKLSSKKVVSVVELKPRAPSASREEEDAEKRKRDVEHVVRLLREQKKELVQLRRRYKQPSTT